jgi:hypothetical protein
LSRIFLALLALIPALAGTRAIAVSPKAWKQDRLIITFWCPPPATDPNLAIVARDGYTMTWTPEAGLDAARRHGLRAMLEDPLLSPASLDNPGTREKLKALVERVRNHPALEAYYITDEPGAAAFPGLGRLADFLRELDPAHFAYINLFPTYANNEQLGTPGDTVTAYREHLTRFTAAVRPALVSYDHYHFFRDRDGDQYFLNLAMIRDAAREAGAPFLNIIQACTIEKSWRLVNADELRFLVYTTLAYGGRGISYFLYWGPTAYGGLYQEGVRTPLADPVAGLNREINALSPPLMALRSLGAYHATPVPKGADPIPSSSPVHMEGNPDCVIGLFAPESARAPALTAADARALLIANRSYTKETQARLQLKSGIRRIEEFNRTTGRWERLRNWRRGTVLPVTLAPGDGRLFRFR